MIFKTKSRQPGHVFVRFELPACLWADHVYVVGEFNDWDKQRLPMTQDRHGVWSATLDLPAGKTYEFRYLVDGHWLTDGHADGVVTNAYGTQNSVVQTRVPLEVVEEQPARVLS